MKKLSEYMQVWGENVEVYDNDLAQRIEENHCALILAWANKVRALETRVMELEDANILLRAEAEAAGSVLLDVQRECAEMLETIRWLTNISLG